ncbi:MAG: glycosyltransferase family 2 protein [Clostridium sp.]|jgi:GT2 family glycosyltransferase|nr:glycosyltransferase family 2 protein [Clostridium sp.]
MEKATVVIPNFNGAEYIGSCIDSLYAQAAQAPEGFAIIVVDDASTDGSVQLVRDRYPEVRLLCLEKNAGFSHAVNAGIREARTPYVILLNNDTVAKPGFVASLVEAIEQREDAFAVSARMLLWDRPELADNAGDRYCALGWAYARGRGKPAAVLERPREVFSACGGAAIYRKTLFGRLGYFDERHFAYLEDVDLGYRARIYGYRSFYEPRAQVLHIGSASSGSRYNPFKTRLVSANSVYLIWKNMPILQCLWNLPFLVLGFLIKTVYFFGKKMGILYVQGLWRGIKLCTGPEGRKAKVPFEWRNLGSYLAIQGQLYLNLLRFFTKG